MYEIKVSWQLLLQYASSIEPEGFRPERHLFATTISWCSLKLALEKKVVMFMVVRPN
jgi:hypothetical protein